MGGRLEEQGTRVQWANLLDVADRMESNMEDGAGAVTFISDWRFHVSFRA